MSPPRFRHAFPRRRRLLQGVELSLLKFISDVGRDGRQRVIAVAVSPAGLAGPSGWRLLDAGASDAIVWKPPETAAAIAVRRAWMSCLTLLSSGSSIQ
jgi:hypothetical protein